MEKSCLGFWDCYFFQCCLIIRGEIFDDGLMDPQSPESQQADSPGQRRFWALADGGV